MFPILFYLFISNTKDCIHFGNSSLFDKQVVDKMQSDGKSKRQGWRTELPSTGLGPGVIDRMKDDKSNDVSWQGKCSGTVYVYNCKLCNWNYICVLIKILSIFLLFELPFWVLFFSSYIGGSESEGHFSVINEACSMLVRYCSFMKRNVPLNLLFLCYILFGF